jgi:hypothetical protein
MPLNQLIIVSGRFPTICGPFQAILGLFVYFNKMHKRFWECRNTSELILKRLCSISFLSTVWVPFFAIPRPFVHFNKSVQHAKMPLNQLIIVCGRFPTIFDPFWAITRPFVHFHKMHKWFWECKNASESTHNRLRSISHNFWYILSHYKTVCAFLQNAQTVLRMQ